MYAQRKVNPVALLVLALASLLLLAFPAYASNPEHLVNENLYADGSVTCMGADDTSVVAGYVLLKPVEGGVSIKVRLRDAAPNRTYTIAVSEEPNCANPQFYSMTTNRSGNGNATIFYATSPGSHNLLVNLGTSASGLSDARYREIATTDAMVIVPVSD